MKYIKRILKIAGFIIILSLVLAKLNIIFIRKSDVKPWDMINKISGYFNEDKPYDVIFFGTSHAYCSFDTEDLAEHGISSYILASQKQPLEATYYYIKEAIKRSKLKAIYVDVLDALAMNDVDEGSVHTYTDYFPMGINKAMMIKDSLPPEEWAENVMPLIKYHTRWRALEEKDYKAKWKDYHDDLNGFVKLERQSKEFVKNPELSKENLYNITKAHDKDFREKKYAALKRINDLAKKNGVEVHFIKTPIFTKDVYDENIAALESYAHSIGADFIDFTKVMGEELGFDDYYDASHLNDKGALKFTEYFIKNVMNK